MSFWEDLSSPVKIALVAGVIGIIGSVLVLTGVFDEEPEAGVTQQRGYSAETVAAPAGE